MSSGVTISSMPPAFSWELNALMIPAEMSKIASQRRVLMLMSQTQMAKYTARVSTSLTTGSCALESYLREISRSCTSTTRQRMERAIGRTTT